jgi:hypothetical protein
MTTTAEFRLVSQLLSVGQRRPHVGAAVLLKPLGCLALGVEHHQLDPVRGHVFGELGHLLVVAELHHVIQAVHFKAVDVHLVHLAPRTDIAAQTVTAVLGAHVQHGVLLRHPQLAGEVATGRH